MGYTHYFTPKESTDEQWAEFIVLVKKLHKKLPKSVVIKGGQGINKPIFDNEMVWFNGDGSNDLDHETFLIEKDDLSWSFCKTNNKPYDLFVCAVLMLAKWKLKFSIESDGDREDWSEAINFFIKEMFGEPITDKKQLKLFLPDDV